MIIMVNLKVSNTASDLTKHWMDEGVKCVTRRVGTGDRD